MAFFDPLPRPDAELVTPGPRFVDWPHEPPSHWIPGAVSWVVPLAQTEDSAVFVSEVTVFHRGVRMVLTSLIRPGTEPPTARPHDVDDPGRDLRFGLQLADGTKVVLDRPEPGSHTLISHGGGGDTHRHRRELWLWPLPPKGRLELVCQWDSRGIAESRRVVDASELHRAAQRAVELWAVPAPAEDDERWGWFGYAPLRAVPAAPSSASAPASAPASEPAQGVPVVPPDTKDWTWVLDRPCPECGLEAGAVPFADIPRIVRANAEAWQHVLAAGEATRARPRPEVWSPLEYACHVRDVLRLYDTRLHLMLDEDDPLFENWDQDATAVEARYAHEEPQRVAGELDEAAERIATSFEAVPDDALTRTGRRSDGAAFTVESFGRYFVHDPVHHLSDVTGDGGHGTVTR